MKKRKILSLILTSVFTVSILMAIGMSVYAFSDIYEPYYPQLTATTRSVDDIYLRASGPNTVLPDEVVEARKQMIQMYKDVGIDITYDMENWLCSYKMIANAPQRWSTETPIPLGTSPDYSGAFSIDACWNNKIPKDAPRVEIPRSALNYTMGLFIVKANVDNSGWGTGIPQIVSKPTDPLYTIASKYTTGNVNKIHIVRAPENIIDYVNNAQIGDEHIMFVDGETHTAVQTWWSSVPGDPRGYSLSRYRIPDFDIRGSAASVEFRLDGIGSEGQCGVNAANPPTNAFTIKSSEISSTTEMINHAIGGAIGQMISGRVYPAPSTDAGMMVTDGRGSDVRNTGMVPYGGIIQLDPDIDLDAIYKNKKLSFHAYRILKAMQEYGYYNIDCSDSSGKGSITLYTSTYGQDWVNKDFEGFNVPYRGGGQGFENVMYEIRAFMGDDSEWFGLSEDPKLFVTIPVVKYADLDVNDDGVIDITDHDLIMENLGVAYSDATAKYDVDQDKEISGSDVEKLYNYINDLPMHTFNTYDVSFADNDETHGRIVVTGFCAKTENGVRSYKEGNYVSFGADAENGWEFDGWTGDFAKYGKQPAVKVIMDKDLTIGAKYKKKDEIKVTTKVVGPGHVELSENGIMYAEPQEKYGENTLVVFKAVPDEGYQFLGWAGDVSGFNTSLTVLLDKDTEVIAMFGEAGYQEPWNPKEWECIAGSTTAYVINEGKNITFSSGDGYKQENLMIVNKNTKKTIDLNGDYSIRTTLNASGNSGDALTTKILFNYKNPKNYYIVNVGCAGSVSFGKVVNGIGTTLKSVKGDNSIVVDGTVFKPAMDIEVTRKGSYFYVYGYKDGKKYEYFKVRDKSHKGGTYGVGIQYNGRQVIPKIVVSKAIGDSSKAVVQTWTSTGDNDPWKTLLKDAVSVAVDSEKAYIKGEYTDGAVKSFFGDDGKTMYVPVRYVTEKLGGKVTYDPATDHVVVSYGDKSGLFKAWENGAVEKDGTLYVTPIDLATALGKQYYKYKAVVIFSDTPNVFTGETEPTLLEFIKKTFDIRYYMADEDKS